MVSQSPVISIQFLLSLYIMISSSYRQEASCSDDRGAL